MLWAQEIIGRERGTGSREARRCSCSSLSLSSAMARVLELEPAAAPATVLESEGTGGSTLVTPDMGNEGRPRPRGSHGRGL